MTYQARIVAAGDNRTLAVNADRSFFFCRSILASATAPRLPKWGRTGNFTDDDLSRTGYPAYCAIDGMTSRATYLDPARDSVDAMVTATDCYLMFQAPRLFQEALNLADAAMLWIANLKQIVDYNVGFSVEIANLSTFASAADILHWQPLTSVAPYGVFASPNFDRNGRIYAWTLGHPNQDGNYEFRGLEFVRVHFFAPAGTFAVVQPQVLEFMIGPKDCLDRSPNMPAPDLLRTFEPLTGEFMSSGGTRADIVMAESRTAPSPAWSSFPIGPVQDPTSLATIDNAQALLDEFRHARHGTKNFVFIMSPASHPEIAPLYHVEKSHFEIKQPDSKGKAGSFEGQRWLEQGPFVDDEQPDAAFINTTSLLLADTQCAEVASPTGLDGHNAMTWSAWFHALDVPAHPSGGVIFQKANASQLPFGINLLRSSGSFFDTLQLIITDGTTGSPGTGATYTGALPAAFSVISGWHHIAVAYLRSPDGVIHARCEADIDGVPITMTLAAGSNVTGAIMSSSYAFAIGAAVAARSHGSAVGPCGIDEAAVINGFMEQRQRSAYLYNRGRPRPLNTINGPNYNLLSWWRFENSVFDEGPNGNTAALINGATYTSLDHP